MSKLPRLSGPFTQGLILRDRCKAEMARCAEDPELWGDPGDAHIDIDGNPFNVCTVLYLLRALGFDDCDT